MMMLLNLLLLLLLCVVVVTVAATSPVRKTFHLQTAALIGLSCTTYLGYPSIPMVLVPPVHAVIDCNQDCVSNCNRVAPGSQDYCKTTCTEYCAQTDRQDGLSGSVDASKGETGIFGGSIDGTVRRGDDKPPSLMGIIPKETMQNLQLKAPEQKYRKGIYWKDVLAPKEQQ